MRQEADQERIQREERVKVLVLVSFLGYGRKVHAVPPLKVTQQPVNHCICPCPVKKRSQRQTAALFLAWLSCSANVGCPSARASRCSWLVSKSGKALMSSAAPKTTALLSTAHPKTLFAALIPSTTKERVFCSANRDETLAARGRGTRSGCHSAQGTENHRQGV